MKKLILTFSFLFAILSCEAQLYINEFMADNDTVIVDDFGEYEDWIELYNAGSTPVNIAGYYLTDDATRPTLSKIPAGDPSTIIPANGFLLLWADSDDDTQGTLHLKFRLNKGGEFVGLYTPDSMVIDSLSFGPQGLDESYGRATDGGTPWIVFTTANTTPGASNSPVPITDPFSGEVIQVYPNPVSQTVFFSHPLTARLMDATGKVVRQVDQAREMQVNDLPKGMYFLAAPDKGYIKLLVN
jgi:hypothetical protein